MLLNPATYYRRNESDVSLIFSFARILLITPGRNKEQNVWLVNSKYCFKIHTPKKMYSSPKTSNCENTSSTEKFSSNIFCLLQIYQKLNYYLLMLPDIFFITKDRKFMYKFTSLRKVKSCSLPIITFLRRSKTPVSETVSFQILFVVVPSCSFVLFLTSVWPAFEVPVNSTATLLNPVKFYTILSWLLVISCNMVWVIMKLTSYNTFKSFAEKAFYVSDTRGRNSAYSIVCFC